MNKFIRLIYATGVAALVFTTSSLFAGDYGPIIYASKKPTTKNAADYGWMQNHSEPCKPYEAPKTPQNCTNHDLQKLHKTKVPDGLVQLCREGDEYEVDPWLLFKTKSACEKLQTVSSTNYAGRREYKEANGWKPIVFK